MPFPMRPWILFLLCLLSLVFPPYLESQVLDGWTNLGIYGGHVRDIAIDPDNPSHIFAATDMGHGLYLSQDGGNTWQAQEMPNAIAGEDTFNEHTVYAVAIAPSNPDIVWVAHNYWVAKSKDGGHTWEHIANSRMQIECTDNPGRNDNWRLCRSIAINPVDPDLVYVGTSGINASDIGGAIYVTTDGGGNWRKLNQGTDLDFSVEDIAVSPDQPDIVWAVTNTNGGNNTWEGTIYRSEDSGNRFSEIQSAWVTGGIFAIAPKPDNSQVAFAATQRGLLQLVNRNGQWQASYPVSESRMVTDVVFAPSDANTLYASWTQPNATIWKGDESPKLSKGQYNSDNWTWETLTLSTPNATALTSLAVHPGLSTTIMAGDSSLGILSSEDSGEIWTPRNTGLDAVIVYDLATDDTDSAHMLAASCSGLFERKKGSATWLRRLKGDFRTVHFQPSSHNTYYGGGYGFVARTTDGGATWAFSTNLGNYYISDIAIDNYELKQLYITTGYYGRSVLRSRDGGDRFEKVLNGINQAGQSYSMNKIVIDPHNRMHLLAAGGNFFAPFIVGDLWESFDGGDSWRRTGLTNTVVNTVIIDPIHENIMYAGCGSSRNHSAPVVKSMDAGATWQPAHSGLPFIADRNNAIRQNSDQQLSSSQQPGSYFRAVTDLAFNTNDPDIVYAETYQSGVYISPNQADDWMNLGPPTHRVFALTNNTLFADSGMDQRTGTGVITGRISDGQTLAGINKALVVTDLGHRCEAIDGSYMMVVPAGIYDLFVAADNFDMKKVEAITVIGSEVTHQDFVLAPDKINHGSSPTNEAVDDKQAAGSSGYCFIATMMRQF